MYWIIDAVASLTGTSLIIYSLLQSPMNNWLLITSLCWIWIYPLLLEGAYNCLLNYSKDQEEVIEIDRQKIVYRQEYNISIFGMEKYHSFDSFKYGKVYQILQTSQKGIFIQGGTLSRKFIMEKMGWKYLLKLCYGFYVLRILELPLWFVPAWVLRWKVMDPMLIASSGSILAAQIALKTGWAINLSGGYHHASFHSGGGFCIYPDISLTVHFLRTRRSVKKIMIIDLDAHQGNGYARDYPIDDELYIVDCYNSRVYPQDVDAKAAIQKNMPIDKGTTDEEYIKLVESIKMDFQYFKPEFVIYNAGTDILDGDPLGALHFSQATVILRDAAVIELCRSREVPVAMLLSGGYHAKCAQVIARSIDSLLQRFS